MAEIDAYPELARDLRFFPVQNDAPTTLTPRVSPRAILSRLGPWLRVRCARAQQLQATRRGKPRVS